MKNKITKLFNDSHFLKRFLFWSIFVMICSFGYAILKMINTSELEFMILCGGLLIFDMIIYSLLQDYYQKILLNDILKANHDNQININKLKYNFNSIIENEQEVYKLAAKYEGCWKTLKMMLENSNNKEFIKCMNDIEDLVTPSIEEEMKKLYKEDRN